VRVPCEGSPIRQADVLPATTSIYVFGRSGVLDQPAASAPRICAPALVPTHDCPFCVTCASQLAKVNQSVLQRGEDCYAMSYDEPVTLSDGVGVCAVHAACVHAWCAHSEPPPPVPTPSPTPAHLTLVPPCVLFSPFPMVSSSTGTHRASGDTIACSPLTLEARPNPPPPPHARSPDGALATPHHPTRTSCTCFGTSTP
jgi:hypothetical protein